jgi:hypothetical protein
MLDGIYFVSLWLELVVFWFLVFAAGDERVVGGGGAFFAGMCFAMGWNLGSHARGVGLLSRMVLERGRTQGKGGLKNARGKIRNAPTDPARGVSLSRRFCCCWGRGKMRRGKNARQRLFNPNEIIIK